MKQKWFDQHANVAGKSSLAAPHTLIPTCKTLDEKYRKFFYKKGKMLTLWQKDSLTEVTDIRNNPTNQIETTLP